MARVMLFGAAWIALLGGLAMVVGLPSNARVSTEMRSAAVAPAPQPPRAGERYPGWTVTSAYSAHHMMVVEVETDHVDMARQIAAQLVEPLKDRYDEVLVYIRRPNAPPGDLPARRIQWTPRGGYVESVYGP